MWPPLPRSARLISRKLTLPHRERRLRPLVELLEDRLAPAAPVDLPFTDTFTAANGAPLSDSWAAATGAFSIQNNELVTTASSTRIATLAGLAVADVALEASVNVTGPGSAGLVAREADPSGKQMYWGGLVNSGGSRAEIWKEVAGAWTLLASGRVASLGGDYRFEVFGSSLKLLVNGLEVASASDSAISTAGSVGLWAPPRAVFDDFQASDAPAPTMTLPFSVSWDNKADGAQLATPWAQVEGAFAVQGGRLVSSSPGGSTAVVATDPVADVAVEADLTAPPAGSVGVVARQSGPANDSLYWGGLVNSGGGVRADLWLKLNSNWQLLASQPVATASAHVRLEVVGASLKLFVNDQLTAFAFNGGLPAPGLVGIWSGPQGAVDNFQAGPIATANAVLPFGDSLGGPDGGQLSGFWNPLAGNFTVVNNAAGSLASGASMAVLRGVSAADVTVQADVQVSPSGSVGVTARQSGAADMYWGGISGHNGNAAAEIWVERHGNWVLLATAPVNSASGTLALDVSGASLTLSYDGDAILHATDTSLTAPGSAGLWASNQSSISNFSIVDPPAASTAAATGNALLTLALKPLNLNLLGLQVQSSPITVTLTPVQGDGKLLGNLLNLVSSLVNSQQINAALNNVLAATVDLLNSVGLQVAGVGSGDFTNAQPAVVPLLQVMVAPVHLDLLGVQVDTSPIQLSIMARSGPGLVLGNVLAALANLFNPPLPKKLDLAILNDRLTQILASLNQQIPGIPSATTAPPALGTGQILSLTVPAINLNLLGLHLTTTPITVNASTQQGNGMLLGNVLQTLLNTLGATPSQLSDLSNNLNQLLAKVIGVLNASTLILPSNALASLSQALQTLALPNLIAPSDGASAAVLNLVIASPNGTTPPVNVNLLGLVVTTSNINAQLSAQTGQGQVLGNLLYNLANLLNPGGPAALISLLTSLASGTTPSTSGGTSTSGSGSVPAAPTPVLTLTVPPLNLNLLGLQVQSDPITVNVSAQSGNAKLLGNLLTGVSTLINTQGVNKALNNVLATTVNLLNSVGLNVSGVLNGSFTTATPATTPVLDLSVAPVHLDLLGALVDTNTIHLKITAQSGPGLVLGNVIAALANLFNPPLPNKLNLNFINTRLAKLLSDLNAQIPAIAPAQTPPVTLASGQILSLTVPAINLNLLGLNLQTTPITVNANASTGNGLLLGNVLQTLLNTLGATPGQLSDLSTNLNNLLAKVVGVLNASTLLLPSSALSSLAGVLQTLALPNLTATGTSASTPVLNLVVASSDGTTPPVSVNLLGVLVTTSNIDAQLSAQTGQGQVLGNLVYNVANLLNTGNSGVLAFILAQLAAL